MEYSIVIPVFNSSKTLGILLDEINSVMIRLQTSYEILFVDDCSIDDSWSVLKILQSGNQNVRVLRLANNVGQWMATLAGIKRSLGKHIITIDDDLEYDTNDIERLIHAYHTHNAYIVYGIPYGKKDKNISYKLFFRIRDYLLRFSFNKNQTESFKIFKREIYFNDNGLMHSYIHFEAHAKFTVHQNYVRYQDVTYRKRLFGKSNHTLWMKIKILLKYGVEFYSSPFVFPLCLILISVLFYIFFNFYFPNHFILAILTALISMSFLLISGLVCKYLSYIFFKLKGLPEYVIIEEY